MDTTTEESPERLDAEVRHGRLIVSEHRGRYLWAAQFAQGLAVLDAGCGTGYGIQILEEAGASRVVGVDISDEAVAQASASNTGERVEVLQGDLRALQLSDGEFDLVVCFEVIEHVADQEAILDELARVVKPDGVLCISTPNRGVYPPGNPHHVHEYEPAEFEQTLSERFAHVVLHRQTAWLASAILSDAEFAAGSGQPLSPGIVKTEPKKPGEETFTVALAAQRAISPPQAVITLGAPFEVRWWQAQLDTAVRARDHEHEERDNERTELGRALLAVEAELASAENRVAELRAAQSEVTEWAAEQVAEREKLLRESDQARRDFENRLCQAERTIDDMTSSLSWRLTSPLRLVKRLLSGG